METANLEYREESGIPSVAVKCVDIRKNTSGEGDFLDENWRWGAKARGANGIRYPGSPGRKRWVLGVGGIDPFCAGVNAIVPAWGSTTARLKLKGIDGGPQAVEYVV